MSNGDELEMFARLCLALLLGAVVGLEREFRGHEAGVRTSSLVCLGAAIFGELSYISGDDRIAAGVVQGVGFLGAGLIYVRRGAPLGVTTAAMTWVLAGLGLLVSMRLSLVAILLTALLALVLELAPVSDWVYRQGRARRRSKGQGEPDHLNDDPETKEEPPNSNNLAN